MWHHLIGKLGQFAGTAAATQAIPAGSSLLLLIAHASGTSGTVTIFGGPAITIVAGAQPLYLQNYHTLMKAEAGNNSIVFSGGGIDAWYIQTISQGNV